MDAKALKALTGHKRQMAREKKAGITKHEDQHKRMMKVLADYYIETGKATQEEITVFFKKL